MDSAHLTNQMQAALQHKGVDFIFLDIEPNDWGRELGIPPGFAISDRVVIHSVGSEFEEFRDCAAAVLGHSFDWHDTRTWSYVVLADGVEEIYCTGKPTCAQSTRVPETRPSKPVGLGPSTIGLWQV